MCVRLVLIGKVFSLIVFYRKCNSSASAHCSTEIKQLFNRNFVKSFLVSNVGIFSAFVFCPSILYC